MHRIYLSKRKKKGYWIKDCLDNKKLGKLIEKNNTQVCKIKKKYRGFNLAQEALFLVNEIDPKDFQIKLIRPYLNFDINLNEYPFEAFFESCRLKQTQDDLFGRTAMLHPAAHKAWKKMQNTAKRSGVFLKIISAFRSYAYQQQLIANKIKKGQSKKEILKVNTLAGFSEHHTGCAIDIGTKNDPVLEAEFDQSKAFNWLKNNAHRYDFYLSYPKNNTTGICYEPWHWCYKPVFPSI